MIARRRARLRLHEALVEHVDRDQGDAEHEQPGLATQQLGDPTEAGQERPGCDGRHGGG
jgi:hypothetical protein